MPIYLYECPYCGYQEEQLISKKSERHKIKCTSCGKKTKLVPSLSNFKLNGTGWYVTDYKNTKKETKDGKK